MVHFLVQFQDNPEQKHIRKILVLFELDARYTLGTFLYCHWPYFMCCFLSGAEHVRKMLSFLIYLIIALLTSQCQRKGPTICFHTNFVRKVLFINSLVFLSIISGMQVTWQSSKTIFIIHYFCSVLKHHLWIYFIHNEWLLWTNRVLTQTCEALWHFEEEPGQWWRETWVDIQIRTNGWIVSTEQTSSK